VSLSADGDTIAVSAPREDSGALGINGDQNDNSVQSSGAVYVFARDNSNWIQQAYIKANNSRPVSLFASSLSLRADGDSLAVGMRSDDSAATGINGPEDDDGALGSGAAYIYVRQGNTWQQQSYLKSSNTEYGDLFGSSVSMSADGETLAVGALGEDSAATGINGYQEDNSATSSGAVYLY